MLRREVRYPNRLNLAVSAETKAALDQLSRRHGIAPGVLGRWAIEAGIPKVGDRLRKSARSEGRKSDAAGANRGR